MNTTEVLNSFGPEEIHAIDKILYKGNRKIGVLTKWTLDTSTKAFGEFVGKDLKIGKWKQLSGTVFIF